MRNLLYYVPGAAGVNEDTLRLFGLSSRLPKWAVRRWNDGPKGTGALVTSQTEIVEYDAANQTWFEGAQFWVGFDNARKPGPRDLQRPMMLEGYGAPLLDGNEWCIPRVKKWNGAKLDWDLAFPYTLRAGIVDGRARVTPSVAPEFQPLEKLGTELVSAFCNGCQWEIEALFQAAKVLLERNYYMGAEEISLLGLLDVPKALLIARLAVDEPFISQHARELEIQGLVAPEATE